MRIPSIDIGFFLQHIQSGTPVKGASLLVSSIAHQNSPIPSPNKDINTLLRREIHQYLMNHSAALPKSLARESSTATQRLHHQLAALVEGLLVGKGKQAMRGTPNAETRQLLSQTMRQLQLEVRQWLSVTTNEPFVQGASQNVKEDLPAPMASILQLPNTRRRSDRQKQRRRRPDRPPEAETPEHQEAEMNPENDRIADAVESIVDWLCRQRDPVDYCAVGHRNGEVAAAPRGQLVDDSI